jgi:hypothetical protein
MPAPSLAMFLRVTLEKQEILRRLGAATVSAPSRDDPDGNVELVQSTTPGWTQTRRSRPRPEPMTQGSVQVMPMGPSQKVRDALPRFQSV